MRNLVFVFATAILATNAAACGGGGGSDEVVADLGWSFKDIGANNTSTVTPCPAGFDTVKVIAIPVDEAGTRIGDDLTDLLDCVDGGSGDLVSYDPGNYQIFLEVRQGAGGALYAQSLSEFFDLTAADDTFDYVIFNNGGYFSFGWDLRRASDNAPLNCQAAGTQKVDLAVTPTGTADLSNIEFPCSDGGAVTAGIIEGGYTASISALDNGGNPVGIAPAATTRVDGPNVVTDLGLVVVQIDAL